MKRLFTILMLLNTSTTFGGTCINPIKQWRMAVADTQIWKYTVPKSTIIGWTAPLYDDNLWLSGQGGIGFGDGDDSTVVPDTSIAVYMRRNFNIADTSDILALMFVMDYDDGFIAYLNGKRIALNNLPINATWNTRPTTVREAQLYQFKQPAYYYFDKSQLSSLLVNGNNVLSVQTHNGLNIPLDLTSRPFLMVGMKNANNSYMPLPNWFVQPMPLESNLPIVNINTGGQTIIDNPRIFANMDIIFNVINQRNCILDQNYNYHGKISIEYRGSSSQSSFPKKPYGFSTVDAAGLDSSVSLMGMPKESDWILLAPYTDKTFMRDVLIYDLARSLYWYSSRVQFVELVINNQNLGVHILMEKIKRDKGRVDVEKLDPAVVSGDELTGGYIFKVDKVTGNSGPGFTSSNQGIPYQYHDPNWNQITTAQKTYLNTFVNIFEYKLFSSNFMDPDLGYRKIANVYSFVDFMLLNELSNNIDGYRLSTYMHKDRDSKCGRFTMGPYWDFNLSFGNANYCNGGYTGWQMIQGCGSQTSKYIAKMLQDPWYKNLTRCRWEELRTGVLHRDSLWNRIDANANYLREAASRDSAIWRTLGTYVWPNAWTPPTWQNEIDSIKNWVSKRLNWLDQNMYASTMPCFQKSSLPILVSEVNYHSDSSNSSGDWIELYNNSDANVDISNIVIYDGAKREKYCVIPNGNSIKARSYFVIYADSLKFENQHPNVVNKYGPLCFNLSNDGQLVVVCDANHQLIDSFRYSDMAPWPITADGWGRTLERINPKDNPSKASTWIAGCMGGSPGVQYSLPCKEPIVINEINYNSSPSLISGDWLELYNRTDVEIDLSMWKLAGNSLSTAFTFPNGTLLKSKSYLVVANSKANFNNIYSNAIVPYGDFNFGLSSTAELLRLYDNNGIVHTSMYYETQFPWDAKPNGSGYTLSLQHIDSNINVYSSWKGNCFKGTPGKSNYKCVYYPNSIDDFEKSISFELRNIDSKKYLMVDAVQENELTYQISDMMGRVLKKGVAQVTIGLNLIPIDELDSSILFLNVQTKDMQSFGVRYIENYR